VDASELVECQLDLRRVLDEGAVDLFQLVLERLEKLETLWLCNNKIEVRGNTIF
jgi:hypothetical protein